LLDLPDSVPIYSLQKVYRLYGLFWRGESKTSPTAESWWSIEPIKPKTQFTLRSDAPATLIMA